MPWSASDFRPRQRQRREPIPPGAGSRCWALLVIDQRPLRGAAWAEFHSARKRGERASRDLERHEKTDTPAFQAWLKHTFPEMVSALRALHQDVARKSQAVDSVQFQAALTGRSVKKIWSELKAREADPEGYERRMREREAAEAAARVAEAREGTARDGSRGRSGGGDWAREAADPEVDDFWENLFGESDGTGFDDGGSHAGGGKGIFGGGRPETTSDAKDIYRRLVQRLHPDRGGEWTAAREKLWHEVQEAWAAGDGDWLARIEIDWETAHDIIGPDSSIGRLRRAILDLDAARRDIERKLRGYRKDQAWRFSLSEKKRAELQRRVEAELRHDLHVLRSQIAYLDETIAAWEAAPASSIGKRRRRA